MKENSMCKCVNVEIGSYDNQVSLIPPIDSAMYQAMSDKTKPICIDKCVAAEVQHLWTLGIVTTGSCCGHNKLPGFIGVEDEFIPLMKQLGYTVQFNRCRPGDEDSFNVTSL